MALNARQIDCLRDSELHQMLPNMKHHFARVEPLLRQIGPQCPRLIGIWQSVLIAIYESKKIHTWFDEKYPDISGKNSKLKSERDNAKQQIKRERDRIIKPPKSNGIVDRSLEIIRSKGKH